MFLFNLLNFVLIIFSIIIFTMILSKTRNGPRIDIAVFGIWSSLHIWFGMHNKTEFFALEEGSRTEYKNNFLNSDQYMTLYLYAIHRN